MVSGQALARYGALFSELPETGAAATMEAAGDAVPASGSFGWAETFDPPAVAEALEAVPGARAAGPAGPSDYDAALALDRAGRPEEAAAVLARAIAASEPPASADACLGLSVLALRAGALGAARVLAGRCLQLGARHPRACCILGLAALDDGDEAAAQTYLAAAARIARGRPTFADDLRGAQRVLLMMRILK